MKIIGLCGFKNSGKTTIATHLVEKHGFKETTFAKPLKDITAILYGFDRDMLEGDTEETRAMRETLRDPIWNRTGREALQFVGTDVFRAHHDENTWVKIAMREVDELQSQGNNIVISDLRFPNEYNAIKKMGGEVWQINRDEFDEKEIKLMHASENSFLEFEDVTQINNYSTIKNLKSLINMFMRD